MWRSAPGKAGPPLDPASLGATLRKMATPVDVTTLPAPTLDAGDGHDAVKASALADGKYTVFVSAKDKAGTRRPSRSASSSGSSRRRSTGATRSSTWR